MSDNKIWCSYCRSATHNDDECHSTRPAGWKPMEPNAAAVQEHIQIAGGPKGDTASPASPAAPSTASAGVTLNADQINDYLQAWWDGPFQEAKNELCHQALAALRLPELEREITELTESGFPVDALTGWIEIDGIKYLAQQEVIVHVMDLKAKLAETKDQILIEMRKQLNSHGAQDAALFDGQSTAEIIENFKNCMYGLPTAIQPICSAICVRLEQSEAKLAKFEQSPYQAHRLQVEIFGKPVSVVRAEDYDAVVARLAYANARADLWKAEAEKQNRIISQLALDASAIDAARSKEKEA